MGAGSGGKGGGYGNRMPGPNAFSGQYPGWKQPDPTGAIARARREAMARANPGYANQGGGGMGSQIDPGLTRGPVDYAWNGFLPRNTNYSSAADLAGMARNDMLGATQPIMNLASLYAGGQKWPMAGYGQGLEMNPYQGGGGMMPVSKDPYGARPGAFGKPSIGYGGGYNPALQRAARW